MSERMEGKQKTPSVIARLMGLDELAPQQPLHRQQKVLSDDYLRKTASIGLVERRSLKDVHLSKISAEKQDKYFLGSEISKVDKRDIRSDSDERPNSSKVRADFNFSRQRNSHAKDLSKDKKFFHLKGLDGVLGDLHANNSLRYYHHPDLPIKQFGDPKKLQPESVSMSTGISDDSKSEDFKKLDKTMTKRIALRSPQELEHNFGQSYIDPLNISKSRLDLKDSSTYFSRKIVVLKPNTGVARNSVKNLLMPKSSILSLSDSDDMDHGEIIKPEKGNLNIEVPLTAGVTSVMEPRTHSFKLARGAPKQTSQVARKITGRNFGVFSRAATIADKSSPNVSEELSFQSSFDCKRRDWISYPFPSGSLFTVEAKKQIFERWKSTNSFQEVEVDDRRYTLGEMFVLHDGGVRPKTSYAKISQFSHEGKKLDLGSPLRVSSSYRSKDKHIRDLPRLEIFKKSSTATGNSNLRTIGPAFQNGLCIGHNDTITEVCNTLKNNASHGKDRLEPRDTRSSHEKKKCSADNAALNANHDIDQSTLFQNNILCSGTDGSPIQDTQVIQDVLDFDWDKMDINREAECSPITVSNFCTKGLASVNAPVHSKEESVVSSEDQLLEIAHSILPGDYGYTHASSDVWENLIPQRSSYDSCSGKSSSSCATDSNSAINLKEINQPSPSSVLEPPFKEENPFASEFCFSHADLSGLAMKLELLNSTSEETISECSGMNVSSDEDNEKGSADVPQCGKKLWEMSRPEESRDFSYLVDVLDEANLWDTNLDNLYETWLSMEFPMNPSLFEALEKKYGKQTSWLKSDRRLLFDRINSGLKEVMDSFMDIQISAKPLRRRFHPTLRRHEIEEELWMLLLNQEKEVIRDLSKKTLWGETKWLHLEEDISIICSEIEEVLFNELVAEFRLNESS